MGLKRIEYGLRLLSFKPRGIFQRGEFERGLSDLLAHGRCRQSISPGLTTPFCKLGG